MNTNDAGQPAEESRQSSAGVSQSEESSSEVWKTPLPPAETSSWQAKPLTQVRVAALIIVAAMIGSWLGVPAGKSPLGFMFPAFAGIIVGYAAGPLTRLGLAVRPALSRPAGTLRAPAGRSLVALLPRPGDRSSLLRPARRGLSTARLFGGCSGNPCHPFPSFLLLLRHECRRADWPEWSSEPHGPLDPEPPQRTFLIRLTSRNLNHVDRYFSRRAGGWPWTGVRTDRERRLT